MGSDAAFRQRDALRKLVARHGGRYGAVLNRDGRWCQQCGMPEATALRRFKRRLFLVVRPGQPRDRHLEHWQLLCMSCQGRAMTPTRRMTWTLVRRLRRMYRKGVRGYGYTELGKQFGLADSTVHAIIHEFRWKPPAG